MGIREHYRPMSSVLSRVMTDVADALMIVCTDHNYKLGDEAAEPMESVGDDTPAWLDTLRACFSWQNPSVAPTHSELDVSRNPAAEDSTKTR